jgi:hypothetical protein
MDEAQVKALIDAAVSSAIADTKAELTTAINVGNQGVAAKLSSEIRSLKEKAKATPEPTPETKKPAEDKPAEAKENLEAQALKTQIAELQKQFDEANKATQAEAANAAFSDVILSSGAQNAGALKTIFQARIGDKLKRGDDGSWFVADGDNVKTLATFTNEYLASDEGKFFKPPASVKGAGSTESKPTASSGGAAPTTTESAIAEAFANI